MESDKNPAFRPRRVLVALPDDEFATLAGLAQRETRTPDQQATHLIRQALRSTSASSPATEHRELVPA